MYEFSMITKKKDTFLRIHTYKTHTTTLKIRIRFSPNDKNRKPICIWSADFFKIQYLKWKKKQKKKKTRELLTSSSNAFEKRLVK